MLKRCYFARSLRGTGRITLRDQGSIQAAIRNRDWELQFSITVPEYLTAQRADIGYIYRRDLYWLDACQAMIAEVSFPSHGVGYEIAYAYHVRHLPILLLAKPDTHLSAMLADPRAFTLRYYSDPEEVRVLIDKFLETVEQPELPGPR